MSQDDVVLRKEFENILQRDRVAESLIRLFESVPQRKLRRALFLLSEVYPDKIHIEDEELEFICYILSHKKFIEQETIRNFIFSLNIIEFSEKQKEILRSIIPDALNTLSEKCTYELEAFLSRIGLKY